MVARLRLKGGELTYVGPGRLACDGAHQVPVLRVRWLEDTLRLIGRNGRPRNPITLPGYGKGRRPGREWPGGAR